MNEKYAKRVNSGDFPEDIKVPIDEPFVDERGEIKNIWLGSSNSVTLITSKKDSERANHIHKNDFHVAYVVYGKIKYLEADEDLSNLKEYEFKTGDSFLSPPNKWHKMIFLEDTMFITMNGIIKNHSNYENSIIRK